MDAAATLQEQGIRSQHNLSYLKQCFDYDGGKNRFFWKERPSDHFATRVGREPSDAARAFNRRNAGKEALRTKHNHGYWYGSIDGVNYLAHRVVFLFERGRWPLPNMVIDHINGDPSDNRINNLREVFQAENCRNSSFPSVNTSGHMNIAWDRARAKWRVSISGRTIGRFEDLSIAIARRDEALKSKGYHPNHGRKPGCQP